MENETEKTVEISTKEKKKISERFYNPQRNNPSQSVKIQSIESTEEFTRIDFLYTSSERYYKGGWIQMDKNSYIQPVGASEKYVLIKAIGIPITPLKHHFKRKGERYTYTLIFPGLPKGTAKINIIEKEAPGNYFNFYNVDYSQWMTVPHAMDLPLSNN